MSAGLEARRHILTTHITDISRRYCDLLASDPAPDLVEWAEVGGEMCAVLLAVQHYFKLEDGSVPSGRHARQAAS